MLILQSCCQFPKIVDQNALMDVIKSFSGITDESLKKCVRIEWNFEKVIAFKFLFFKTENCFKNIREFQVNKTWWFLRSAHRINTCKWSCEGSRMVECYSISLDNLQQTFRRKCWHSSSSNEIHEGRMQYKIQNDEKLPGYL